MQAGSLPPVWPVILSGGSGSRLWPLSTPSSPKQFHRLVSSQSLLQTTFLRFAKNPYVDFIKPMIVCNESHRELVQEQLAEIDEHSATIVLEPCGRSTAPAAVVAADLALQLHPEALILLVPVDHLVTDLEAFYAAVARGAAVTGRIVTLGLYPTTPDTRFGYIKKGLSLADGVFEVAEFTEKPDRAEAERRLAEGDHLWNAGMFLARPELMLSELNRWRSDIVGIARRSLERGRRDGDVRTLDAGVFRDCPSESLDYSVMERTSLAAVAPCEIGWADIGSWTELWRMRSKDARDNAVAGDVVALDADGCLIDARDGAVVALGVRDLVVVAADGNFLVAHKDHPLDARAIRLLGEMPGRTKQLLDPAEELSRSLAGLEQWLLQTAMPLWASAGIAAAGGFEDLLGLQDASPVIADRRLLVQARQAFVYAQAGQLGWDGPWRALCERGLLALEQDYRRPDGLVRRSIRADGSPADDAATLYDQAFALFAQAAATRAGVQDLSAAALRHLEVVRATFGGGWALRENGGGSPFQANPNMHLFEAALAWSEACDNAVWRALADELGDLCLNRFIDREGGFVREFYDERGRPAAGEAGRIVEPGHQFEWAWLLARWGVARGSEVAVDAARTLFDVGERWGVDRRRGVAVDIVRDDGAVLRGVARLWPQTERLKAALAMRSLAPGARQRASYEASAAQAAGALIRYLDVPTPGLWRDKLGVDDRFIDEPAPASSFYHLALAIMQPR